MDVINKLTIEKVEGKKEYIIKRVDFSNKNGLYLTGKSDSELSDIISEIEISIEFFLEYFDKRLSNKEVTLNNINSEYEGYDYLYQFKRKLIY